MGTSLDTWIIYPSEKGAERKGRELFLKSPEVCWLGETIFSLPHFLKTIVSPQRPLLKRNSQRHLIAYCLKNAPLRYFEKLKKTPSLSKTFLEAISNLKRHLISPDDLETILKETGSLKEYDLLKVFQNYETLKEKLEVIDEEDLYPLVIERVLKTPLPFTKLTFENFLEAPRGLKKLIQAIAKAQVSTDFKEIPSIHCDQLKNVKLFSLPTPFQETHWFIQKLAGLLEQGTPLEQIGILVSGRYNDYEALWQKLKNCRLASGPSPFLSWRRQARGRLSLKEAASLDLKEATLEEWLTSLIPTMERDEELSSFINDLRFQEYLLNFGTLQKQEFVSWLGEALEERPKIEISSALSGLQWIEAAEGDFPPLKYLWVPGLTEGKFPSLPPLDFFQDKKERGLKEWETLCEAFPDAPLLFEKKQKAFLYPLSQIEEEAWLTYPRISSLGQDCAASPFTWEFELSETVRGVETVMIGQWTNDEERLEKKIKIEKERLRNQLETKEYHTRLDPKEWRDKIEAMQEKYIFSPSQLETYAQCPFKYYAWRILTIPRRKEYTPEVDPEDRGTLFHDCLEKFFRENTPLLEEAREAPEKEASLFSKLEACVENIFEEKAKDLNYANRELYRHLKEKTFFQAKKLLKKELEEGRQLEAPLKPSFFEWRFGKEDQKPLLLQDIQIGGRIDRIDRDPQSGRFLVLDYKTGDINKFKERVLQGLSLQLPLYLLAVRELLLPKEEMVGGLLVATKTGEKKVGLVDQAFNKTHFLLNKRSQSLLKDSDLEESIEEVVKWVETYVEQIRSGFFSAQPKECKPSCDYREICRYAHKPL